MSINASIVILYILEGFARCWMRNTSNDKDNPHGTEFDLRGQMELPFQVNESSHVRDYGSPISPRIISPLSNLFGDD